MQISFNDFAPLELEYISRDMGKYSKVSAKQRRKGLTKHDLQKWANGAIEIAIDHLIDSYES